MLVGETLATDLVLSCRPVDAVEALRGGLVSRVVPVDSFEAELAELEARIGGKPREVLRMTKRQLLEIRRATFDARSDADSLLRALNDPESMEYGMRYIQKRIQKS